MKKPLIISSIIIMILAITTLLVPFLVDINNYKDTILNLVKDKTGREIRVDGDITLHIVPDISINLKNVSIPSSFRGDRDLFKAEKMVLQLQLKPLFHKQLKIDTFELVKPLINITIRKNGDKNWEVPDIIGPKKEEDKKTEPEKEFSESLYEILQLNDVKIIDGYFSYNDMRSGISKIVDDIDLSTELKGENNPFNISGRINGVGHGLGKFSLKGQYYLEDKSYGVKNLSVKFDDTSGNGEFGLDLRSPVPELMIALNFNKINFDNYLQDSHLNNKDGGKKSSKSKPFDWSDDVIDVSFLRDVNVHLSFSGDEVVYDNTNIEDIIANLFISNAKLTCIIKQAKLFGGGLGGEISVDALSTIPKFSYDIKIENFNIKKMPESFGIKDWLDGNINGNLIITSRGDTIRNMVKNSDGVVSFSAKDGAVTGVDLISMIDKVTSNFNTYSNLSNRTKFNVASGEFDVVGGVATNENFVLETGVVDFTGAGTINFPDLKIDYRLIPKSKRNDLAKSGLGARVPITISGSLLKPKVGLEVKNLVNEVLKDPKSAEKLVDDIKSDLKNIKTDFKSKNSKESIEDGLIKTLDGFLGGGAIPQQIHKESNPVEPSNQVKDTKKLDSQPAEAEPVIEYNEETLPNPDSEPYTPITEE